MMAKRVEEAEQVVKDLITELESRITSSRRMSEITALRSVVYVIEDKWNELMNEIEWRSEV